MPIICLCGIDGSGKASQVSKLKEIIVNSVVYDFPRYDTPTGQLIKKVLKIDRTEIFTNAEWAMLLQSLHTTNRQEVQHLIREYKDSKDKWLILDRYYLCGLAYGEADGLPREFLINIHRELIPADCWFFIEVSVNESFKRRPERRDNYEKQVDLLERVNKAYWNIFQQNPNPFPGGKYIIDGEQPEDAVTGDIVECLKKEFPWILLKNYTQ